MSRLQICKDCKNFSGDELPVELKNWLLNFHSKKVKMTSSRVTQARLIKLAKALCMEPIPGVTLILGRDTLTKRWFITGLRDGDCWLPRTNRCSTPTCALECAEGWLAPELDTLE